MRLSRYAAVIGFVVILGLSMNRVGADSSQVFYLHKWVFDGFTDYPLDENQPTQYNTPLDLDYLSYCWRTGFVSSNVSVDASIWTVSLWLGYTIQSTSLNVGIGYMSEGVFHPMTRGNITSIMQFPKKFILGLGTDAFQIPAGGALALQLTPVRNTLNSAPNVVLYLDSASTPSQVSVEPATPIPDSLNPIFVLMVSALLFLFVSRACSIKGKYPLFRHLD